DRATRARPGSAGGRGRFRHPRYHGCLQRPRPPALVILPTTRSRPACMRAPSSSEAGYSQLARARSGCMRTVVVRPRARTGRRARGAFVARLRARGQSPCPRPDERGRRAAYVADRTIKRAVPGAWALKAPVVARVPEALRLAAPRLAAPRLAAPR